MHMYKIQPSEALASLLETFDKWGGVVNYVQIGTDDSLDPINEYVLHKQAAIFTAQTITDRTMNRRRRYSLEDKTAESEITDESLYRLDKRKGIQIRADEATGQRISVTDFFAPPQMWIGYDELDKLPSWWNQEAFIAELKKYSAEGFTISTGSYPYTFANPPYNLFFVEEGEDIDSEETAKKPRNLFDAINQLLFGGQADDLIVYHWSTDWIDFLSFEEGYDWWGSYLWTVSNPRTNSIVGIAAATTD